MLFVRMKEYFYKMLCPIKRVFAFAGEMLMLRLCSSINTVADTRSLYTTRAAQIRVFITQRMLRKHVPPLYTAGCTD